MTPAELKKDRAYFIVIWLITYSLWTVFFLMVGEYASTLHRYDLTTGLDHAIPLMPGFVWFYVLSYAYPLLPLFITKDWHRFTQGLIAFVIANFSAAIVYVALPVAMTQPALGTSLSERMLASIYAHDFIPSANKLPSMHVIAAWVLYFMCIGQGQKKVIERLIGVGAVLITISTVFTKQHLVLDVFTGLAWAWLSWKAAGALQARYACATARATFGKVAARPLPLMAVFFGLILMTALWVRAW